MGLMAEISAWIRFAFRTSESEKAIVFYSEQASYWAYFEGVIEGLRRQTDVPFCYVTSDADDPVLSREDPHIHAFYLKTLLPYFMLFVKCKAFVMTLTELNQLHLRRSIHPVHYIYIFHSLNSTHMAYQHGAFDHYDSILCCGPFQIDEFRREEDLRDLPEKELVEAGYYRLERVYKAAKGRSPTTPSLGRKGCILVAPSWAARNVLEEHGISLVEKLVAADYRVIMRAHPETIKRHPELVDDFASHFEGEDRVMVERSVTSDDSLLEADVLITDWSGIAQEYGFGTERPVLYLDVPMKVHNERWEEVGIEPFEVAIRSQIGLVLSPDEISNIDSAIDRLIAEREAYRERIVALRAENVFCFGSSGEVGARHILDVASRKANTTTAGGPR